MFKDLIYAGEIYDNFEINEEGDIRNKKTGTIYKKGINATGYYTVTLPMGKRGKVKCIRIHKAIAEAFIPNPNGYPVVNHLDENKLNNKIDNLQWSSYKYNTNHSLFNRIKENCFANNRKLTRDDVKYIREHKEISIKKLAKQFNVSTTAISDVIHYRSYNNGY